MEHKIIFVITTYIFKTRETEIFSRAFRHKKQAIDFIESKLTEEEKENNKKAKMRGLLTENEFFGKKQTYKIRLLEYYE